MTVNIEMHARVVMKVEKKKFYLRNNTAEFLPTKKHIDLLSFRIALCDTAGHVYRIGTKSTLLLSDEINIAL